MKAPHIEGFLSKAKTTATGGLYRGRFACHEVQWTGDGSDVLATFTITADELADAAESRLLWTDQDVQRGIQPGLTTAPPRELALSDGYPNPALYIFDAANADDMVEKLLSGGRLFLGPLVWNLRPETFEAYWDATSRAHGGLAALRQDGMPCPTPGADGSDSVLAVVYSRAVRDSTAAAGAGEGAKTL